MQNNTYTLVISDDFTQYEFLSVGIKGTIKKVVTFSESNYNNFYDLALTDYDPEKNFYDDLSVSSNGDTDIVLATVAHCIVDFLEHNPEAVVLATGSTHSRNRLYRMAISKNLPSINGTYKIYGLQNKKWSIFQINTDYIGFLIKKINA